MRHLTTGLSRSFVSALALATAFEAFLVICTQDSSMMVRTPWQDDPYHAWISLAVFALPMLLAVVVLRVAAAWLPWGRSSSGGRRHDLTRAGLVLVGFVGATALDCWVAVVLREHRPLWDRGTTWLLAALGAMSVATAAVAHLGVRDLRALPREPGSDWVGDVLPDPAARWVRRHDRAVFLAASVAAAVAIIGALAYGERWTDPLLIGWALSVEVACYYAFCVVTNALLGFVERPQRDRPTERALVTGSLVLQAAVAFHGKLEPLLGVGSPDGVPRLVEVTIGPGLVVFLVMLVALRLRPVPPARPAR